MLLSDREIAELADSMILPFFDKTQRSTEKGVKSLSYGLGPFGYDVRLSNDIYLFSNVKGGIIDPKAFTGDCLVPAEIHSNENGDFIIIPPNSYMLGKTIEYIRMPNDVSALCVGKSTMARCGLMVNTTPIWAGFKGEVVLEAANTTTLPMKVYLNEGFATLMFFKGNSAAAPYIGLYQFQLGVTFAKG